MRGTVEFNLAKLHWVLPWEDRYRGGGVRAGSERNESQFSGRGGT